MEEVNELIARYGLQEDPEHVIIFLPGRGNGARRCFLLKRRFIRIVSPEGHHTDHPLADAIEATIRYPDLLLSEALRLLAAERGEDHAALSVLPARIEENAGPLGDTPRG